MSVKIQMAAPVKKHLKVLFYGPSGSGKTLAALTFPRPLLIDAEAGSELYRGRPGLPSFHVADCKTLSDLSDVLRQVESDAGKTWGTLIIDPISVFYAVEKTAASANNTKDMTFRDWSKVNSRLNALYTRLTDLPLHIVIIAREATEYAGEGNNLRKVGVKPDADKSLAYSMDFVLRLQADHSAVVEKSRGALVGGKDGLLPSVSWSVFDPVAAAYTAGESVPHLSDDEAAAREADSLQQRENAAAFVTHWRGQSLTDADILAALGVSKISEWSSGRKAADAAVQAYLDHMAAAPPARAHAPAPVI